MSVANVVILLVGSNAACLVLGYLFGRLTRATLRIEESIATDELPAPARPWGRQRTALVAVALAVALVGVITAVVGFQVTRNQDRLAGCVMGYSNGLGTALDARSKSQQQVNNQIDQVFEAILGAFNQLPEQARTSVQAAFESYVKARAASKEAQQDNPLPDVPRDACAELTE